MAEAVLEIDEAFVQLVRDSADAEVANAGFVWQGAQAVRGPFGLGTSVLYESAPDEFAQRFPHLASRRQGAVPCVDLWVELHHSSGDIEVRLEGDELGRLLDELGRAAAASQWRDAVTNARAHRSSLSATLPAALKQVFGAA